WKKAKTMLTMKLNEDEWLEYENVMQDVVKTSGLNKSIFYDLRGNHDIFGVPAVGSSVDFFPKYSINGQMERKGNVNTITVEVGYALPTWSIVDSFPCHGPPIGDIIYYPILWLPLYSFFLVFLIPKCIITVFKKQYTLKKFIAKKRPITLVLWILQYLCRMPVVWFGYMAYLFYLIFFPWFSGEVYTDSGNRTYMTIIGWVVTSSGADRQHEYSWLYVVWLLRERSTKRDVSGMNEDDHDRGRKKRSQRRSSCSLHWLYIGSLSAYERNVVHFPGYSLVVPLLLLYVICKTHP
ncbi:predicted protein, partial [Arabidopsis lyrata subsp. lyrata]